MSSIALKQAVHWHDALMDAEHKGRKDNESAARFRLSKKIGVPESYLYRLAYKRRDMRDVAGEVYRRLQEGYAAICLRIETSADAMDAERQLIEETDATSTGHPHVVASVATATQIKEARDVR